MSRTYTGHCITFHAYRVQARAFAVAIVLTPAFWACVAVGEKWGAFAIAIAASIFVGISIGAWIAVRRFRE